MKGGVKRILIYSVAYTGLLATAGAIGSLVVWGTYLLCQKIAQFGEILKD